ncbi:transcriptional regulator with XRE-family HTH domain [Hamadaea flava]|uniref:Uncharacterized protein n=1 Tax=Hamadaea flava TaxID=1742688 RepID=A0ABV8LY26_9ACTN|nr:transcriptional regulator with XRE-family HTH domain [Hamadaea flava]
MTVQRKPNTLLRAARLGMQSPSGSGRPLSRQELADLVNVELVAQGIRYAAMDASHVGKYERGEYRWPQRAYRDGLRAVLGAAADAELGFYIVRGADAPAADVAEPATGAGTGHGSTLVPTMDERRALTVWLRPSTSAEQAGRVVAEAIDA